MQATGRILHLLGDRYRWEGRFQVELTTAEKRNRTKKKKSKPIRHGRELPKYSRPLSRHRSLGPWSSCDGDGDGDGDGGGDVVDGQKCFAAASLAEPDGASNEF